jgi:hypothetical protein
MIKIAQTTQASTAKPEVIFALWEDVSHWPQFDHGIEWARLEGKFAVGSKCTLKPKGGPRVKATIVEVVSCKSFVDVSYLLGAELRFEHVIDQGRVSVVIALTGPLSGLWAKILGKNQQADLERSTANLIAKAEGRA